jgi:hypothetical protein
VKGPFGSDWISQVYAALCAGARDEVPDESALDTIFEAYRASERELRSSYEEFRNISKRALARFLRPSIVRPMMELVAMVHGRGGTWA